MDERSPQDGKRPSRSRKSRGPSEPEIVQPDVPTSGSPPPARHRSRTRSEPVEPVEVSPQAVTNEPAEEEEEQLSLDALSAAYASVKPTRAAKKSEPTPDRSPIPDPPPASVIPGGEATLPNDQRPERAAATAAGPTAPAADLADDSRPLTTSDELSGEAGEEDEEDYGEVTPRGILEAMLFVGSPDNRPLTSRQIAALMRGFSPREVDDLIVELNQHYLDRGCPYEIASQGAGYVMQLRRTFEALRYRFLGRVRDAKLSQQAIDVLAIVAYRQPLEREEIEKIRGKPCGGVLSQLVRRQLLRIEQTSGRPRRTRYLTTDRFLEVMGLESLSELPQGQDFDLNR